MQEIACSVYWARLALEKEYLISSPFFAYM